MTNRTAEYIKLIQNAALADELTEGDNTHLRLTRALAQQLAYDVNHDSRYVLDTAQKTAFEWILNSISPFNLLPTTLYRAQIGVSTKYKQIPGSWVENETYFEVQTAEQSDLIRIPLGATRLKPDRIYASSGRANAEGITVLYCAGDIETALLEVRAPAGSACTIAECVNNKELRLADLREVDPSATWGNLDQAKDCLRNEVAHMFSKRVIGASARYEYTLTQQISEHLKQKKYDGIIFSSSQGDGWNYAFFDINSLDIMERNIVEITSVNLKFSNLPEKTST